MAALSKIAGCDNRSRRGDVIFVHGLDGDARTTWHPRDNPQLFWPAWLGQDIAPLGIWTLSYEASSSFWNGNSLPLADRATNLLALLESAEFGARNVVFIAHSLGGLLVKQLLRHALDFGNVHWQSIADHTKGIVFLSTPHTGSNVATLANYLRAIVRPTVTVDELQADAAQLRNLNIWYRNCRLNVATEVYCEKRRSSGVLVVDESSADPGLRGVVPIPVDSDHAAICKFDSRESWVYARIRRFVEQTLIQPSPPAPVTAPCMGSGGAEAQASGLQALVELMQLPAVSAGISVFQEDFRDASAQITLLSAYKTLHDLLQQLENHYAVLYQETRGPAIDWQTLDLYELELQAIAEALVNFAERVPASLGRVLWTGAVTRAEHELREAIDAEDVHRLKSALNRLQHVLNREPSQINSRLVAAAHAIRLSSLAQALRGVRQAIGGAGRGAKVQQLEAGIEGMKALDDRLTSLVQQHNALQNIDDEVRRVEGTLGCAPEEIREAWRDLRPQMSTLHDSTGPSWNRLTTSAGELDAVLASGDVGRAIHGFRRFRSTVGRTFNQVDKDLLCLCEGLQRLGDSLAGVLKLVQPA